MSHGLGTRTLRGMAWAYGSYVGGRLLVLLSVAILARLLTPTDFGVVGFALAVTGLLDRLSDLGVSQALIVVRRQGGERQASTAWTLSVLLGAALSLLCAALSPLAVRFFHEPELRLILPALGVNFVVRALGSTHFALAQKQMDFRTRTVAELADVVVRGASGVALAVLGAGAWSLVGGYLAGSLAMTLALWALVPFRPRVLLIGDEMRALLRFGTSLTVLDVLAAIIDVIDYVIVGRVLGATALGLYTLGFRLPELLILNLAVVAAMVLFPAFAELRAERVREAFLMALRYTVMLTLPATLALTLLASPIIRVAFGSQWTASVECMQLLTIYAFAVAVGIPAGTVYKATGRVGVLIVLAIPRTAAVVGLILAFVDDGIVAVAACQAVVASAFAVIGIVVAARLLRTRAQDILRELAPSCIAGAAMAAVLVAMGSLEGPSWRTLLVQASAGLVAYVGVLGLAAPAQLRHLWRAAFPLQRPAA